MQDDKSQPQMTERQFFWSCRTLRCDRFEKDDAPPITEDVLGVDRDRCIFAYGDYGDLIVRLLNEYFRKD